eukprot:COSAG01_NODE_2_length_63927_cov_1357.611941_4_plen_197_part_00
MDNFFSENIPGIDCPGKEFVQKIFPRRAYSLEIQSLINGPLVYTDSDSESFSYYIDGKESISIGDIFKEFDAVTLLKLNVLADYLEQKDLCNFSDLGGFDSHIAEYEDRFNTLNQDIRQDMAVSSSDLDCTLTPVLNRIRDKNSQRDEIKSKITRLRYLKGQLSCHLEELEHSMAQRLTILDLHQAGESLCVEASS